MKEIASNNYYSIKVDEGKNRLYFAIIGFWKEPMQVPEYVHDMEKATKLLSKGFTVLSDLTQMKTPAQEIGPLHVKVQQLLVKAGLSKTAELQSESALTKMNVDKVSKTSGMAKGTFTSIMNAEIWLNS